MDKKFIKNLRSSVWVCDVYGIGHNRVDGVDRAVSVDLVNNGVHQWVLALATHTTEVVQIQGPYHHATKTIVFDIVHLETTVKWAENKSTTSICNLF